MHIITSFEDNKRKILSQKFWSHGTPKGALGPLSREDVILGFVSHQILVIWGPYESLVVVTFVTQAENLKTAGAWCGILVVSTTRNYEHHKFKLPLHFLYF